MSMQKVHGFFLFTKLRFEILKEKLFRRICWFSKKKLICYLILHWKCTSTENVFKLVILTLKKNFYDFEWYHFSSFYDFGISRAVIDINFSNESFFIDERRKKIEKAYTLFFHTGIFPSTNKVNNSAKNFL